MLLRQGRRGRLARKISGYRVKEIADYFPPSPATIGEAIIKAEDLLRKG